MLVVLVAFFLCFMATVLMYSSIFATARRHHKKMATAMHQASSAARNSTRRRVKSSGSVTSCKSPVDKNQVRSKEEASNIDGMETAANGSCNVKQDLQKGFMVRLIRNIPRIFVGCFLSGKIIRKMSVNPLLRRFSADFFCNKCAGGAEN